MLIENNSELRMVSGYQKVLDAPSEYLQDHVWHIGVLLADTGHLTKHSPSANNWLNTIVERGTAPAFQVRSATWG